MVLTGRHEEFYSIGEPAATVVIKLSETGCRRFRLSRRCLPPDVKLGLLFELVKLAVKKLSTRFSIIVGTATQNQGKKREENAKWEADIVASVGKGHSQRIMNVFFHRRKNSKWTGRGQNSQSSNAIVILTANSAQDVQVLGKAQASDRRKASNKIRLHQRKKKKRYVLRAEKKIQVAAGRNKGEREPFSLFDSSFCVSMTVIWAPQALT